LADRGVRAVITPSFGDIFAANAMKNGMLAVVLPAESVASLMAEAEASTGAAITIDLPAQTVTSAAGTWSFEMNPFSKRSLLEGLDDLAFTLTQAEEIAAFERRLGRSDS
jgi:3-isopropylmalate/(R)-2-methylmalate dehydratase small subunit